MTIRTRIYVKRIFLALSTCLFLYASHYFLYNYCGFRVKTILINIDNTDKTRSSIGQRLLNDMYCLRNKSTFITGIREVQNKINQSSQISKLTDIKIIKKLPDTLIIYAHKKRPIAMLQSEDNYMYIDDDGEVYCKKNKRKPNTLIITGTDANKHVKRLIKKITNNKFIMSNIVAASFVSRRRWNLYLFKHGIKIMLPEEFINSNISTGNHNKNNYMQYNRYSQDDLLQKIERVMNAIDEENLKKIKYIDCRCGDIIVGT